MRYLGGKSRLAKQLSEVMLDFTDRRQIYIEPFIGGGSVLTAMAPHFDVVHGSDICPDLMALWEALQGGWIPPDTLTEDEYQELRKQPYPSALKGFAKYGCSFGGKAWGGYARNRSGTNYYAQQSKNSLMRQASHIANTVFSSRQYQTINVFGNEVIYCDPPYAGTTGYGFKFDHTEFWEVMEIWARSGANVFVSEKTAPESWLSIHEIKRNRMVEASSGMMVEHLFVYDGSYD